MCAIAVTYMIVGEEDKSSNKDADADKDHQKNQLSGVNKTKQKDIIDGV